MKNKKDKNNISIRKIIIFTFLVGTIVSTSLIGNIVFSNWISSINGITQNLSIEVNREISDQIYNYLIVPKHINEVNEKVITNGIVDLSKEAERDKYFVGVLQSHKNEIYSFTYGMENGDYYGARRNEKGEVELVRNNASTGGSSWYYSIDENLAAKELVMKTDKFDVRTRDWYQAAKESGIPTFSSVYKHFVMEDLTISAATPIYDTDGNLQGVLGTHMILSNINDYIHKIVEEYNGYAIVMENDSELLIANSFGSDNYFISADGSLKRNTLDDLDNTLMSDIFRRYSVENQNNFLFTTEKGTYYANVLRYHNEGLDWIIISAIPNNIFTQQIYHNMKITVIIILLTILLVVTIYLIIIKQIFKPIDNLIITSKEIAAGNLTKSATIVRNDEIGKLSDAFNFMADKMFQFVINLEDKVKERTAKLELANVELKQTKEDLYLILDTTAEGIFGIDMDGKCIFCNQSGIKLLGYQSQEEIFGKSIHSLIHNYPSEEEIALQESSKILHSLWAGEKLYEYNGIFWKEDGTKIDVEYHSYPKLKDGIVIGAVITFIDITEKKKDEEQIKYLSCHDFLTGLINRRCFESKLRQIDTPASLPISIIFGDLNGLKLMNDIFGHAAGDKLIQRTAEVLKKVCGDNETVARVGGDEFIVILPQTDEDSTLRIMQQIKSELSKETVNEVKCNIALGFHTKTDSSQNLEKVMGNAESEMYKDKLLSKKTYGFDTIQSIQKTLQDRNLRESEHAKNVAILCAKMGAAMGLPETEMKQLKDVGFIHDIGKIVLEEKILRNEELNENERRQMEQHPVVGYKILNLFDETLNLADAVYAHHENWDGTGYPRGLKGEEIPLISRIIAIVEKYEKILAKEKINVDEARVIALNEISKQSGKAFDPKLTELFVGMMRSNFTIFSNERNV